MGSIDGWPQIGTEVLLPRSELRAGGSAANTALALRHLGLPAHLISAIGNDELGRLLQAQFHGVRTDLQICDRPSTVSVGLMHACGERNFFTTHGHLEELSCEYVLAHLPPASSQGAIVLLTGVFLLPRLRAAYLRLLQAIRGLGYQVALDTGWPSDQWNDTNLALVASWLPLCDHLLINELEALSITGAADLDTALARLALASQPEASIIVKTGAQGVTGLQAGQRIDHRSARAEIFDTIGAGDSFNAGYLAMRLRGGSLAQALAAGCQAAVAILQRFPRSAIVPGELAGCLQQDGWTAEAA
ncbi:carbohydrate kinase family protein [Pseudoduganella danionis]|nr:carbohydrate kinase family protein [Pseudoduganella danionis]